MWKNYTRAWHRTRISTKNGLEMGKLWLWNTIFSWMLPWEAFLTSLLDLEGSTWAAMLHFTSSLNQPCWVNNVFAIKGLVFEIENERLINYHSKRLKTTAGGDSFSRIRIRLLRCLAFLFFHPHFFFCLVSDVTVISEHKPTQPQNRSCQLTTTTSWASFTPEHRAVCAF